MDFGLNRKFSQLAYRVVLHIHAVARLGFLLLLFSPSLVLASNGADEWSGAGLVGQGDPVLLTTLLEHVAPLQPAEGDASDGDDEPWPGSASAVRPVAASGSFFYLRDGREWLPDSPDFLQAQLRAPPLA